MPQAGAPALSELFQKPVPSKWAAVAAARRLSAALWALIRPFPLRPQPLSTHSLEGRKRRAPEKPCAGLRGRSLPDKASLHAPTPWEFRVTAHVNRGWLGVGLAKPGSLTASDFEALFPRVNTARFMRPISLSRVASLQDAAEGCSMATQEVKSPLKIRHGVGSGRLPLKVLRKGQRDGEARQKGRCSPFLPCGPRPPSTSSPQFCLKRSREQRQHRTLTYRKSGLPPFLPVPGFLTCSPHLSSHSKVWPSSTNTNLFAAQNGLRTPGRAAAAEAQLRAILTSYVAQG